LQAASQLIEEVKTGINNEIEEEIKQVDLDDITTDSDQSDSDAEVATEDANGGRVGRLREKSGRSKKRSLSVNIGEQTDDDKKRQGKITTNENAEESRVDFSVYRRYLSYVGGWKQFTLVNLVMVLFIVCKTYGDLLVGNWAIAEDQHDRYWYYCGMYFFFSMATSFFVFCRVYLLQYFSWFGTKRLHEDMVDSVLSAPVNLYFDTTPTGRILNRFSKDLSVIEVMLVYLIGTFYVNLYLLISIFVVSVLVVYWIAAIFPIITALVIYLFKRVIDATKEVARIESVTKSPLLSLLSETLNGSSTIRAFGRRQDFIEQNNRLLN